MHFIFKQIGTMNDNGRQLQHRSTNNNCATTSNYRNKIRKNHSTNRSPSSNTLSREKSTIIRSNDVVLANTNIADTRQGECSSQTNVNYIQNENTTQQQNHYGYTRGDFISGEICKLQLHDRSYCHAFNYSGDILAVGTATSVDFYDTTSIRGKNVRPNNCNHFPIITSIPHASDGSMTSAITWIPPMRIRASSPLLSFNRYAKEYTRFTNDSENSTNHQLIAVSDLGGNIYLYSVDPDILESQGPTLIFNGHNYNGSQIRSLAAAYGGRGRQYRDDDSNMMLVIAAGDKSGCVTIITFDVTPGTTLTNQLNNPLYIDTKHFNVMPQQTQQRYVVKDDPISDKYYTQNTNHNASTSCGILGIAIEFERGMMAVCTSSGSVQVFSLPELLAIDTKQMPPCSTYELLWSTQSVNASAIRCVVFGPKSTNTLMYGGYDKTIILVDIDHWTITRELNVQGTVNIVQYDDEYRYIGVGCRDKTFTVFDTSTFVAIQKFHTPSWVTSISWACNNIVSIRSEVNCLSILDLSPIQSTNNFCALTEKQNGLEGFGSMSWSGNAQYLAYISGSRIVIVDTHEHNICQQQFHECTSYTTKFGSMATGVVFCKATDKADLLAFIDDDGWLYVLRFQSILSKVELTHEAMIEPNLKAVAWSPDGEILLVGGRKKLLYVLKADDLVPLRDPIPCRGRIWDIDFAPLSVDSKSPYFAVALGDYSTVVFDHAMELILEVFRALTCRCLKFHPFQPILAIGDGAGTVAILDCEDGEVATELELNDRVSALDFSPVGDFLIVGTDACRFALYESTNFRLVQEFPCIGRALSASFSSNGFYLAFGSSETSYNMIRLGPFLGTEFIPMNLAGGVTSLPEAELRQVLFHSGIGPSLLQRHMVRGGPDNLRRVAAILQEHPNAVHTIDRNTGEGCFDTALRLKKPGLLKLFIVSLVDGTLNSVDGKQKTFFETSIPQRGRDVLVEIVKNYPADFIIDILRSITFMKVPYGNPRVVESGQRIECGHTMYQDPWTVDVFHGRMKLEKSAKSTRYFSSGGSIRTPAVLPLPGLGDMSLLANLLVSAPAEVFDNDAMALVLRVLWKQYIRRYYYIDFCIYITYYICWIVLVETVTNLSPSGQILIKDISTFTILVPVVVLFNTIFAAKEITEGIYGMKFMYWRSWWNACDWMGIVSVYSYSINLLYTGNHLVPLAVGTTLCLTIKVLSYLRGFSSTGWLLSVLSANFQDVQGFLVIVTTILVGFSVAFRLLFAETGEETFGSLRRALLSTFELTVMGSYDTMILFETRYTAIAVVTFVMAVTCIVVVVLNALISILSDSYAKVQEHAVANRRREIASLIVEYMTLLPRWRREQIERETTWFHTLLEVDADGSLQVHSEDWEGGLNALRHDMEEMGRLQQQGCERAVERLKTDLDTDLTKFKKEVISLLEDLTDDVKYLRKVQSQGILNFDGHHIKKAVRAVKSVGRKGGEALFHKGAST